MKDDEIVKYLNNENNMRVIAIDASITVDDARIRHRLFPVPAIALGRVIIGALLVASTMKEKAMVNLRVAGDGPLGFLTADASYEGYVRAYCQNPHLDVESLPNGKIASYVGTGQLRLTKYIEIDTDPYRGIVSLQTSEIGEDLAYYFYTSEQIPTAISLGVYYGKDGRVETAGGILVQALPPQKEKFLEKLETIFSRSPSISEVLLGGSDADGIVQAYLPGFELERIESKSAMFKCSCYRRKTEEALISLGIEELIKIKEEDGKIDLTCEYCGQHYYFTEDDIDRLIAEMT